MERNLAGTQAIKSGRAVLFNLPNQLTGMRFLLSFVLFYLISQELWLASLLVFIFAAFTDWLDGHLARTQNMQSSLGRNLDPLVDKVLIKLLHHKSFFSVDIVDHFAAIGPDGTKISKRRIKRQ